MSMECSNIVNVINFLRAVDSRHPEIDLHEAFVKEAELLLEYKMPATFLLQHDALIETAYTDYMKKNLPTSQFEIGGWFEVTQSLVEKAGLDWRGRFSWDWHCNVGFSVGYLPEERKKLVDAYMSDFKEIFNCYPRSFGSWFIDAVTLGYMHDEYGVIASCNCKDQFGTDGYTLWGGYWNQAYYPSRLNSYLPAQDEASQISVPVFRMLGSDPIYQYESGIGCNGQAVLTLEPAWKECGGNPKWVRWFFEEMTRNPSLQFSYAQAGQENSFGWPQIREGYLDQVAHMDQLQSDGKIRIETLEASAKWFRAKYQVTPPTSFVAVNDWQDANRTSSWYNCKNYRANLFTEDGLWRLRDIQKFDQNYAERYLGEVETTQSATYDALPVMDGFCWSEGNCEAGIFLTDSDGKELAITGSPRVKDLDHDKLCVTVDLEDGGSLTTTFAEDRIIFDCNNIADWRFEFRVGRPNCEISVDAETIKYRYKNFDYSVMVLNGKIKSLETLWAFVPSDDSMELLLVGHG